MKEDNLLLTDKELKKHIDDWFLKDMDAIATGTKRPDQIEIVQNIAKAQQKKVVEWGNETCPHWEVTENSALTNYPKHACNECWQQLLKEIK